MTREEAREKIVLAFQWVPVGQLKETLEAILATLEESAVERSITRREE